MPVPRRCRSEEAISVWRYLEAHACELSEKPDEPLTRRQASRELGMSESTIRRALDDEFKMGFGALRDLIRVENALSMLCEKPDIKIDALALTVGWRSRTNLYSAVRRVTRCDLSELKSSDALLQNALIRVTRALLALPSDVAPSVAVPVTPMHHFDEPDIR